jgi:multiple sugar transport system permease protein
MSALERREALEGYLYLLPWALGFIFFVGGPMVASLVFSFTNYDMASRHDLVGFLNYRNAFTNDRLFWPALMKTFYYVAASVPIGIVGSLFAAMLLNQKLAGTNIFRTFYFLPHLTPIVASAILWKWVLNPEVGLVNFLLAKVGIKGPAWFGSKEWAIPSLVIMALWGGIGGNRMLIFLAGLQGVPQELYEAAEIDGANLWHRFRHVTLPMVSPTMFFNMVLAIIASLQVFASAYVATQGGPAYATWFYALHIYMNAFQYYDMGYASALAWIFFAVMFSFTFIQFRASSRWVYYAGETR